MQPVSPRRVLDLRPIDDAARTGGFFLVVDGERFAVAHWIQPPDAGGRWAYPGGQPIDFPPTEYQP